MAQDRGAPGWTNDWQALQKQFTDAWTNAARQAGTGGRIPVHEGFEQWARLFAPDGGNDLTERMLAGARQYVAMMQSAADQFAGKSALDPAGFTSALRNAMGGMGLGSNPLLDAMRQATGQGSKSFENLFGDFMQQAQGYRREAMAGLQLPAFGYTREQQEHQQATVRALADYAEQLNRYNGVMLRASQRGLSLFESKLGERSEPGREIKSLRELYDLWIDAAEEGFAEVALSPEYREAYGTLVNAQMRVRQLMQQDIERATGALGMPTRTEVDATHRKLAEMRRRLARLEEHLSLDETADGEPEEHAGAAASASAGDDSRAGFKARPAAARVTKATTRSAPVAAPAKKAGVAKKAAKKAVPGRAPAKKTSGPDRDRGGPGSEQSNAGPDRDRGGPGSEQTHSKGGKKPKKTDDHRPPKPKPKKKKRPGPPDPGPQSPFAKQLAAQRKGGR